jgi:hypothetical protein
LTLRNFLPRKRIRSHGRTNNDRYALVKSGFYTMYEIVSVAWDPSSACCGLGV